MNVPFVQLPLLYASCQLHVVSCCDLPCCDLPWLQVLAGLPNLQTLSLFSGIELKSGDLQPLTACSKLTSLSTDSIVIGPTTPNPGAAADATGTAGSADAAAGPSNQLVPAAAPHALPLPAAAAAAAAGGGGGPVSQWCLASLKSLSVGNVGLAEYLAPLSTFAPHLTRLKDVSVVADMLQLAYFASWCSLRVVFCVICSPLVNRVAHGCEC